MFEEGQIGLNSGDFTPGTIAFQKLTKDERTINKLQTMLVAKRREDHTGCDYLFEKGYLVQARYGHLQQVYHIFAYFSRKKHRRL